MGWTMARRIGEKWLRKASENLEAAKILLEGGLYASSCFHSQQAAEMALKALIVLRSGVQPFTHSLTELLEEVSKLTEISLSEGDLAWLQDHYLQARYPNTRLSEYTLEEAEKALNIAGRVLDEVRRVVERA